MVVLTVALIGGLVVLLAVDISGEGMAGSDETAGAEGWIRRIIGFLILGTDAIAALVLGFGVLQALWRYVVRVFTSGITHRDATEPIRLHLARTLLLGLEFTLASDLLQTVVAPTREEVATLAAVILLRTLLNLFVEREVAHGESRRRTSEGHTVAGADAS